MLHLQPQEWAGTGYTHAQFHVQSPSQTTVLQVHAPRLLTTVPVSTVPGTRKEALHKLFAKWMKSDFTSICFARPHAPPLRAL